MTASFISTRSLIAGATAATLLAPAARAEINVPADLPLGAAISLAADGETITIQPGVYDGSQGFVISSKALTLRSASGNPADTIIDGFDVGRILEISGAGADGTLIEGLTFRNGNVAVAQAGYTIGGAAIAIATSDVTIANCVFRGHMIANTSTDIRGSALHVQDGSLTVLDSVFEDNLATTAGSDGGAIFCTGGGGAHLFRDCRFEGNSAVNTGGAVRVDQGTAQFTQCVFEANECVSDADGLGGAIFTRSGAEVTIDACVFRANTSLDQGGAVSTLDGATHVTARNSVFQANTSANVGGAIRCEGTISVANCTFEGNAATSGAVLSAAGLAATVDNSILWNNQPNAGQVAGGALTVRHCLVQSGFAGPGNVDTNPMFTDAAAGDLSLTAGSPAIDAGDSSLYAGPFVDLAGNDRATDDPGTVDTGLAIAGPVIDMGAYEHAVDPVSSCPADIVPSGTVDALDFLELIAAWGACP